MQLKMIWSPPTVLDNWTTFSGWSGRHTYPSSLSMLLIILLVRSTYAKLYQKISHLLDTHVGIGCNLLALDAILDALQNEPKLSWGWLDPSVKSLASNNWVNDGFKNTDPLTMAWCLLSSRWFSLCFSDCTTTWDLTWQWLSFKICLKLSVYSVLVCLCEAKYLTRSFIASAMPVTCSTQLKRSLLTQLKRILLNSTQLKRSLLNST